MLIELSVLMARSILFSAATYNSLTLARGGGGDILRPVRKCDRA